MKSNPCPLKNKRLSAKPGKTILFFDFFGLLSLIFFFLHDIPAKLGAMINDFNRPLIYQDTRVELRLKISDNKNRDSHQ